MEDRQIDQVIANIENNIERCDVLRGLLKVKIAGDSIDYDWYNSRGYKVDEIKMGSDLVDLYMKLKNHVDRSGKPL